MLREKLCGRTATNLPHPHRRRERMKQKKSKRQKPIEIPLAAMCFTPGCKMFIDLTKGEAPTHCPKCHKPLEVYGIEVTATRPTPSGESHE